MTDLDVYQPAAIGQYQAGIVMTPESAKALDEQLRACTRAVLREGTDYGVIPGLGEDRKTLLKPGAEKLLQWFGFAYTMHPVDIERDDDGRKQGVTYRCTIVKRIGDPRGGLPVEIATCEGYAGYDEDKFYQSAEQAQNKAEAKERYWAAKDRRVANPEKWKHLSEYRAPWNTVIKMAQKRALVGATVDATAAAGLFSTDEDENVPAQQDDGPSWYEQALEEALGFTDLDTGNQLFVDAAHAARDGLCTPRQATHIQNRIRQRGAKLKNATPVDVEELAGQAASAADEAGEPNGQEPPKASPRTARRKTAAAGDSTRSQHRDQAPRSDGAHSAPAVAGGVPSRDAQPLPPLPGEDEPGASDQVAKEEDRPADLEPGEAAEFGTKRHRALIGIVRESLVRFGYPNVKDETDEQRAARLEVTAKLAGVSEIGTSSDLDVGELSKVADTLARCKDRKALDALLKADEGDEH